MAARRCSDCAINYPVRGHTTCDGCGGKTDLISNASVHPNWREEAEVVRQHLEDARSQVPDHLVLAVTVTARDGHFFLSSWDVCRAGYQQQLIPDTLVEVQDESGSRWFEVGGYSASRREYWLLPAKESTSGSTGNDV